MLLISCYEEPFSCSQCDKKFYGLQSHWFGFWFWQSDPQSFTAQLCSMLWKANSLKRLKDEILTLLIHNPCSPLRTTINKKYWWEHPWNEQPNMSMCEWIISIWIQNQSFTTYCYTFSPYPNLFQQFPPCIVPKIPQIKKDGWICISSL